MLLPSVGLLRLYITVAMKIFVLIRKPVLWQQVSHLLLKYTKSGYETVLTAACARQGCGATE
jgi:hypothetical protein